MPNDIRFLAVTPNIDRAIRQKLLGADAAIDLSIPEQPTPRQTLLPDDVQQSIGGATSYNGYFTIKVRNGENGRPSHIVVCDGATYDAEKHTSGNSTARVGSEAFRVEYFETDIRQGNYLVFLKYTAGIMDVNGTVTQKSKIEVCVEQNSDITLNSGDATFLIGDVNFQDGTVTVIQRFQGQPEQTPYITWYVSCSDFTDYILSEKSKEVIAQ